MRGSRADGEQVCVALVHVSCRRCPLSLPEVAPRHWGEPGFWLGMLWELELITLFHTHGPGFQ